MLAILSVALLVLPSSADAHRCNHSLPLECVPLLRVEKERSLRNQEYSTQGRDRLRFRRMEVLDCIENGGKPHHDACPEDHVPCCVGGYVQSHNHGSPHFLVVLEIVSALALVAVCCFCVGLAYHRRKHEAESSSAPPAITASMIELSFLEVPIEPNVQCVICLAEIDDLGRRLQCGHCFHSDCISNWWICASRTVLECPTCRQIQTLESACTTLQGPIAPGVLPQVLGSERSLDVQPRYASSLDVQADAVDSGDVNCNAVVKAVTI